MALAAHASGPKALEHTTGSLTLARTSGARASSLEALRTRLATYLFHQGTLLEDLGQKDAAATIYARIRDEHAATHKAVDALGRISKQRRTRTSAHPDALSSKEVGPAIAGGPHGKRCVRT